MEKTIIARDTQELAHTDINNIQAWTQEALQHFVTDAISNQKHIRGLAVTAQSSTMLQVAPGRLYDGTTGAVYAQAQLEAVDLYDILPLQDSKWVTISVSGTEITTNVESRSFVTDVDTGQTQTEDVEMERHRVIVRHRAVSLESPNPDKLEPPTGNTLIAHVRINPSGVQEIILAESRQLPNVQQMNGRLQTAEGWIDKTNAKISSITSDIAALGEGLDRKPDREGFNQIAMSVANIKEILNMPDKETFYGADHYLNEDESDTEAVGYSALVHEGIRPAVAGQATVALSLLNPLDPSASVSADGFCLPAYVEQTRLRMENRLGDIRINQYQVQSQNYVQKTMSRERINYGETRSYCTNSDFWRNGVYDPTTGVLRLNTGETWEVAPEDRSRASRNHEYVRLTSFWKSTYNAPYWEAVTTSYTVNGSILAQTVLMAQTGWITSIDLYFTNVDAAGGLTLLLCEASLGQPDVKAVIARRDFAANTLTTGWCRLTFSRPVFVEAGKRYAIVVSTGAQHKVAYTSGTDYTQGVLMYAQDGSFFNEVAERDLAMRLQFAQFISPRAVLHLNPLQLTGGLNDIDLLYEGVVPNGCELYWEYQVAGIWYPILQGTAEHLASTPPLLPIRGIFVGSTDVMPGFRLTNSQAVVSRAGTAFTHFSTTRTLGLSSDDVSVKLLLEEFDPVYHTVDCDLIVAGTPVNAASYVDRNITNRSRERIYQFNLVSPVTEYKIKITGSTSDWRKGWHVAERYDAAKP